MININEFDGNKVILAKDVYGFIKKNKEIKDVIVLTPLTKVSEILPLSAKGIIGQLINSQDQLNGKLINEDVAHQLSDALNDRIGFNYISSELNEEKAWKTILSINDNLYVSDDNLQKIIRLLDDNVTKQTTVIITGFNKFDINTQWSMINVCVVTSNLINENINWGNIESLIILGNETVEIVDRDKFKSWLEMKTKTILSISDINNYFIGVDNLQSFLISSSLAKL